mmetsp:Transcript_23167/g.19203  ORF Transcript_23167/g.19203 Transcript_23167/m.19203 type:complete len:100 (-) Transcript_23167:284-583(-)
MSTLLELFIGTILLIVLFDERLESFVDHRRCQRECGCCYAIQAATMVESRFKIKTGMDRVVPLSVQQLVDCSTIAGNKGCEGGQVVNCGVYLHTSEFTG